MAMTAAVKDELSRLAVTKTCCRRAEVAALLRFGGGLHIVGGRVVVEAELDTGAAARRLRGEIHDLYGHTPEVHVLSQGGLRKGTRYVVRLPLRRERPEEAGAGSASGPDTEPAAAPVPGATSGASAAPGATATAAR